MNPFSRIKHRGDAFMLAHAFRAVNAEPCMPDGVAFDQLYAVLRMVRRITFSDLGGYADGMFYNCRIETTVGFLEARDWADKYLGYGER